MSYTSNTLPYFFYPDYDRGLFTSMSPKEASSFFIDFKNNIDSRIDIVTSIFRNKTCDFSIYTNNEHMLFELEQWLMEQLQTRIRTQQDFIKIGVNSNSSIRSFVDDWEFTDNTKNIISYVALTWGEFLIYNTFETTWFQVKKPKSSVDLHQPCIKGHTKAICNPHRIITNTCLKYMEEQKKGELFRLFDIWKNYF